jgi:ATP-dependent DNA ligase
MAFLIRCTPTSPNTSILDREIVAIDEDGRRLFQALQHRVTAPLTVISYVFDLRYLNGRLITSRPLDGPRQRLATLELPSPVCRSDRLIPCIYLAMHAR